MPYISQQRRTEILNGKVPESSGELNFYLSYVLTTYLKKREHLDYQGINDCLGALDGCAREFYERVAIPYEQKKQLENGDIYEGLL